MKHWPEMSASSRTKRRTLEIYRKRMNTKSRNAVAAVAAVAHIAGCARRTSPILPNPGTSLSLPPREVSPKELKLALHPPTSAPLRTATTASLSQNFIRKGLKSSAVVRAIAGERQSTGESGAGIIFCGSCVRLKLLPRPGGVQRFRATRSSGRREMFPQGRESGGQLRVPLVPIVPRRHCLEFMGDAARLQQRGEFTVRGQQSLLLTAGQEEVGQR